MVTLWVATLNLPFSAHQQSFFRQILPDFWNYLNELINFSAFFVQKLNQPQFSRIFLHRLKTCVPDDFIPQNTKFFIWLTMLSEKLNLSKEQSQKLFPCGEMLAISVSAWLFYDFFQNDIGGWSWKVENICYCNTSFGTFVLNIKDLSVFNNNKSRQFQLTPVIFTGQ